MNERQAQQKRLTEAKARIQKTFQKSVEIYRGSEFSDVARIKTGILAIDVQTGGGFPIGRFSLIYGKRSSGKTYAALRTIAHAQKMCRECYQEKDACKCKAFTPNTVLFVDVEAVWEKDWAQRLGVDLDALLIVKPVVVEEVIDVVYDLLKCGDVDVAVIDSVAEMQPADENARGSEKWTQGLQARLTGRMVRKWVSAMSERYAADARPPTILLINQVRSNIGLFAGEFAPGGRAIGFATSLELKCWSEKAKLEEATGKPPFVTLCFKVDKSKVSTPFVEGSYKIIVADGVAKNKRAGDLSEEEEALALAMKLGLVKRHGSKWEDTKGQLWPDQEAIVDFWVDTPAEFDKVKDEIVKKVTGK